MLVVGVVLWQMILFTISLGGCLAGVRSRFCEVYAVLGIFQNTKVLIQNYLQNRRRIQNRQKKSQHIYIYGEV